MSSDITSGAIPVAPRPEEGRDAEAGGEPSASTATGQPKGGWLDAAAPMAQPRDLAGLLPELGRGGVTALLATVASIEDSRYTIRMIGEWLKLERASSLPFRIARSIEDVQAARACGELAVILHFQGGDPIESDLSYLEVYAALGARVIQITYNARNRLGDGCLEQPDGGLSRLGRAAVATMNELGIVVDLAHVGRRTSLEAVAASSDPVIVSHAGACGVHQSKRNITDALITAVAESGGVIGACAFPNFVGPGSPDLGAFLDHIEYLVQLAGIEHVGIGLDFAQETEADYDYYGYDEDTWSRPPWVYPSGIGSFAEVRNIGTGLAERGYGLPEIEAIASGNFLRVFGEVWKAAAPGQHGASEPGEAGQ